MDRRVASKLKRPASLSSAQLAVAVFRLVLVAGWPAVFICSDNTKVHHLYILWAGNIVSFLHVVLNDCLLGHVAVAGVFLASLLAQPPYRVWGIGSLAYTAIIFASCVFSGRLDKWPKLNEFVRLRQNPA